jgi:hypothetical protein
MKWFDSIGGVFRHENLSLQRRTSDAVLILDILRSKQFSRIRIYLPQQKRAADRLRAKESSKSPTRSKIIPAPTEKNCPNSNCQIRIQDPRLQPGSAIDEIDRHHFPEPKRNISLPASSHSNFQSAFQSIAFERPDMKSPQQNMPIGNNDRIGQTIAHAQIHKQNRGNQRDIHITQSIPVFREKRMKKSMTNADRAKHISFHEKSEGHSHA